MLKLRSSLVIAAVLAAAGFVTAQDTASLPVVPLPPLPQARTSPHETIGAILGNQRNGNRVTIIYGRPYTKDPKSGAPRKVWGTLVPWDKAYRLGADEATTLITQQPLMIGNAKVAAGVYTLYLVPTENGPTKLAISSNIGKWGIPVDEKHDLARVDVQKAKLSTPVDQLLLIVEGKPDGTGALNIAWEETLFSVPLANAAP
jgi:hypothetical protein